MDLVCKHHVLIFVDYVLGVMFLLKKGSNRCILLRFLLARLEYDRSFVLQSDGDDILILRCNRVVLLKRSLRRLLIDVV